MTDEKQRPRNLIELSKFRVADGTKKRRVRIPRPRTPLPPMPPELRKACVQLGLKEEGLTGKIVFERMLQHLASKNDVDALKVKLLWQLLSWLEGDNPEPPTHPAGARRMPVPRSSRRSI